MSGGRVELGLGAGWNDREHAAYGIPFPATGERFDRLEEQLAIITGLWATPDRRALLVRRHATTRSTTPPRCPKPVQRPRPADRDRRVRRDAHAAPRRPLRERVQRRLRATASSSPRSSAASAPRARRSGVTRRRCPTSIANTVVLRRRRGRGRPARRGHRARRRRPLVPSHFAGTPAEVIDRIGVYRDARRRDRLLPGARPARPRPPAAARRRGGARVQLTSTTSLNEWRVGPHGPMPTRAIDATCTNRCQATSSPTDSAHASAALIGDTWLTTITSRVAGLVEQLLARRPHPEAEGGERLAPAGHEVRIGPPRLPDVGGYLAPPAGRRSCRSRARSSVRRPRPDARTPRRSPSSGSTGWRSPARRRGRVAASAAAWRCPSSESGGSARPSSRPRAFASVWP